MLEEFLERQVTAPIYGKGWVDLMIDVDRDTSGKEINTRYKGKRSGGLPWVVIVGPDGVELLSSNAQTGDKNDGNPDKMIPSFVSLDCWFNCFVCVLLAGRWAVQFL